MLAVEGRPPRRVIYGGEAGCDASEHVRSGRSGMRGSHHRRNADIRRRASHDRGDVAKIGGIDWDNAAGTSASGGVRADAVPGGDRHIRSGEAAAQPATVDVGAADPVGAAARAGAVRDRIPDGAAIPVGCAAGTHHVGRGGTCGGLAIPAGRGIAGRRPGIQ